MKKFKFALPIIVLLYFFIGAFFFISPFSANESEIPMKPIIYGFGVYSFLDDNPVFTVELYNPPINMAEFPDDYDAWAGEKICSVETSLTFPKDLIEVQSVGFTVDGANNYSNETGTINVKRTLSGCKTEMFISLFDVTFKPKKLGEGAIHFTKLTVIGGSNESTAIASEISEDAHVEIAPNYVYNPAQEVENPLQGENIPANVPAPQAKVETKPVPKPKAASSSSSTSTTKPATKTENSALKTPALTKLEFSENAVLDKTISKSKGVVFTGTSEPNSTVYILINSQNAIYTDTISGADGVWSKTVDSWLEDGTHTITAWWEKDNNVSPKFSSKFVISSYAKSQIAIGDTYPEVKSETLASTSQPTKKKSKANTLLENKFFLVYLGAGLILIIIIIILFVKSRAKKNDSNDNDPNGGMGGGISSSLLPQNMSPRNPAIHEQANTIYPNPNSDL